MPDTTKPVYRRPFAEVPTKTLQYVKSGLERATTKALGQYNPCDTESGMFCAIGAAVVAKARPTGNVTRREAKAIVQEHYYGGATSKFMPGWPIIADFNDRVWDTPKQRFRRVYKAVCREIERRG